MNPDQQSSSPHTFAATLAMTDDISDIRSDSTAHTTTIVAAALSFGCKGTGLANAIGLLNTNYDNYDRMVAGMACSLLHIYVASNADALAAGASTILSIGSSATLVMTGTSYYVAFDKCLLLLCSTSHPAFKQHDITCSPHCQALALVRNAEISFSYYRCRHAIYPTTLPMMISLTPKLLFLDMLHVVGMGKGRVSAVIIKKETNNYCNKIYYRFGTR